VLRGAGPRGVGRRKTKLQRGRCGGITPAESKVREAAERELQQVALQDGIVKTAHQKWIFDRFIASALHRRIAVARQPAHGSGHKGSRSLRIEGWDHGQRADEFGDL
jgi:hypothetical protein